MPVKLYRIVEKPEYQIEQTNGLWVIWGPCPHLQDPYNADYEDECPNCGDADELILDTCTFADGTGTPSDPDMIVRITGLEK